jgi:transposase
VAVFGILKRGGEVYAQMIADCGGATLVPIVRRKVRPASVVYSDGWPGYDPLSVEGYEHERADHEAELVAGGGRHINGIENFWSQAKRHLRKFNGVPKGSFPLFLQGVVWRFNAGTPREQLQSLRKLLRRRMIS